MSQVKYIVVMNFVKGSLCAIDLLGIKIYIETHYVHYYCSLLGIIQGNAYFGEKHVNFQKKYINGILLQFQVI